MLEDTCNITVYTLPTKPGTFQIVCECGWETQVLCDGPEPIHAAITKHRTDRGWSGPSLTVVSAILADYFPPPPQGELTIELD